MTAFLSLDLCLTRGDFTLEASLALPRGVTAFFGRSGAGKSTLAHLIAGFIRPDRGRVTLDGMTLVDRDRHTFVPPHRRRIAVVFQDARLFPHLSVKGNLAYGQWFRRSTIDPDRIIALLGLAPLMGRRPATLSGGERQRVAIARALMTAPDLLILDEPLSALDLARREEILPYLDQLKREFSLPMIYVSHALDEVVRLADHLVLIENGRIAGSGPIATLLPQLAGLGTGFDSGALLRAQVTALAPDGMAHLAFDGGTLLVPGRTLTLGQSVRLHLQARDVAIALAPPVGISIQNAVPATITEIIPRDGAAVDVRLACADTILVARLTTRAADTLKLHPGLCVWALIKSVALEPAQGRMIL